MTGLSPAQLELRRTGIGASEIAAVCGISPWDSPLDVWLRKTGNADEKAETMAMRAGNMLEAAICDWYAVEMGGVSLVPSDTLRHATHTWALATPDRLYASDSKHLVQCKNVGLRMAEHWGDDPADIPEDYRVQIEWEMEVADAERCDVVVLIGGQNLKIYPITRDRDLAASLLTIGERFWRDHVLTGEPPPVDASDSARRYLERRHPTHKPAEMLAAPEAEEWARRYHSALQAERAADEEKKLAGNMLRQLIGDAEGVLGPWGKATWKRGERGTPAWKQIAESLNPSQQLVESFTPAAPRVLRVYPKKEK